jgi:hypothetical protein
MTVTLLRKGAASKRYRVSDILPGTTDHAIVSEVLDAAGETRSSLFGIDVARDEQGAVVVLWTD